jgi:predicted metal-dependent phosphoesterase TrpH
MRYELHCHTYYSRCSLLTPTAILEECKKKELDGICIVDHNIFLGAVEVESANNDRKFKVIKGIEFSTDIGHIIGLFLSHEIIYDRRKKSTEWLIDEIHRQKGLAILAHPSSFTRIGNKNADDIGSLKLDAIEGFNGRNIFSDENNKARRLAERFRLPITVGSDAHFSWEIGTNIIECNDLYHDLKEGKMTLRYSNPLVNFKSMINQLASFMLNVFRKTLGMIFH